MDAEKLTDRYMNQNDICLWAAGGSKRAFLTLGCRYMEENKAHRFAVWAPHARSISVVSDWNGWDGSESQMKSGKDGIWTALIPGLADGMIYKYRIVGPDGSVVLKADPFAFHSETGPATGSKVWDLRGYCWNDSDFISARRNKDALHSPMSIYELHIGSWRIGENEVFPNYRLVADKLAEYCTDMGYTHVELMPVTEYPFEGSWGYQVTGFFAPTSRYGTPQDFMYFVDRLHSACIGVIMDWVPAHFPKDEHGLRLFDGTPLFECAEPLMAEHPEWGTLIFDYAKPQVRSFLISSAMFFFDIYHIDGIRVDAVSSMLYLDYGRKSGQWKPNRNGGNVNLGAVDFLKSLNTAVLTEHPGCVTIAEEATSFPLVSRPPYEGGLGFSFKWDMGFMHDTLDYLSLDPYFRSKNHSRLTFSLMYAFSENYILAFSHDEVVHGKKSMIGKMWGDYDTKFASLRTLWGYQFAHPGKKLMFMGSEFAQFIEWDYKKGLDWLLLDYPMHAGMRKYVASLNRLYAETPALWELDDSWDGFLWLNVDDAERSSVAFMRKAKKSAVICACNFTPVRYDNYVIGLPEKGVLCELLNSDDAAFGGKGVKNAPRILSENEPFLDLKHSARITLPPLSAVWFRFETKEKKK
ncbi:MAG: 1,4-alpha-glucan branching protein GlgB [Clostridia bacterium]|nr:1,4-alpha-glucan branching protein GlgB [Clostridia bacterium]